MENVIRKKELCDIVRDEYEVRKRKYFRGMYLGIW